MTNKAASDKFRIPRNTISTWMKNKSKLSQSLKETSSDINKLRGCDHGQVGTPILKWFSLQRSQNIPIDGTIIEKSPVFFLLKHLIFQTSKSSKSGWMEKWKR